jgi:hypothetical protein
MLAPLFRLTLILFAAIAALLLVNHYVVKGRK